VNIKKKAKHGCKRQVSLWRTLPAHVLQQLLSRGRSAGETGGLLRYVSKRRIKNSCIL